MSSDPAKERQKSQVVLSNEGETERVRQILRYESPEGEPAHPELTRAGIMLMIVASAALVVLIAAVVALVWSLAAGSVVLVFGMGLACIGNPVIWAAIMRMGEREDADRRAADA
ncbi:MAG: hypothetical protein D6692_01900 [Planctomycetota bacterium]|nr:MAG: hypothetical protein D6692_01900 [Planctomycetota bacterium]